MVEKFELRQAEDFAPLSVLSAASAINDLYTDSGHPIHPVLKKQYDDMGIARELVGYDRDDSPSRADQQFNWTAYDDVQKVFAEGTQLLRAFRHAFAEAEGLPVRGRFSGQGWHDFYASVVQLPTFLFLNDGGQVRNGEFPAAITAMRASVFGIGFVLNSDMIPSKKKKTPGQIVEQAEINGLLVGQTGIGDMEPVACPFSLKAIEVMADIVVNGEKNQRGRKDLELPFDIDFDSLVLFSSGLMDVSDVIQRMQDGLFEKLITSRYLVDSSTWSKEQRSEFADELEQWFDGQRTEAIAEFARIENDTMMAIGADTYDPVGDSIDRTSFMVQNKAVIDLIRDDGVRHKGRRLNPFRRR